MNDSPIHADRVLDLAGAVCNRSASENDLIELDAMLQADNAFRKRYLDYCQMHASLRFQMRARRAGVKLRQQVLARGESDIVSPDQPRPGWIEIPPTVPFGFRSTGLHGTVGYLSSGWPVAYLLATVIVGIGLLIGAFTYVSHSVPVARQSVPLPSPFSPLPSTVGRVTGIADCRWATGVVPLRVNDAVPVGRQIKLESGLMEITYDTGARVILQGPAAYEVDSRDGGFLSVGRLTARVEKKVASGQWPVASETSEIRNPKSEISNPSPLSPLPSPLFVVRTPTAVVTDLGTKFGVEVDKTGRTETHVLQGAVRVRSLGAGSGGQREQVVLAGNAVRCSGKEHRIIAIDPDERRFVRTMPMAERAPHADAEAYARLVLSLKPVVYYRMEPPQDEKQHGLVLDSSGGGHDGILTFGEGFGGSPYVAGRVGQSLRFRGPMTGDYAIVHDYPKATDDRLTVSVWVMAVGRTPWAKIVTNWGVHSGGGRKPGGQFQLGTTGRDGDLCCEIAQRNGQTVEVREGAAHPLPLGQWQHVALVVDESVARLYRNGVQVASQHVAGLWPEPPVASLGIGCVTNAAGTEVARDKSRLWPGRLDELAIFNRALSDGEIRSLHINSFPSHRKENPR